ncbi:MAG TPA: hypothetical protein VLC93_02715 [Myxococcota bacterium]|nr:hypothetical protein [Myxococcota bacterium]
MLRAFFLAASPSELAAMTAMADKTAIHAPYLRVSLPDTTSHYS